MKPSILFIVPATYEALKNKGVENTILERDENGFFKKETTKFKRDYYDKE